MIEERNVGKCIALTFVTCGIYGIIWQLNMANDIKTLHGGEEPNGVKDLILTIVTCGLYGMYVWYKYPTMLNEALQAKGKSTNENLPMTSVLLAVFGLIIVSMVMLQGELNKVANGG